MPVRKSHKYITPKIRRSKAFIKTIPSKTEAACTYTLAAGADIGFIYEAAVNEVHVYDGATLRHKDGSTDQLLWNAKDLVVDAGGELVLSSFDESIAGNFIGGGMLRMQAES